GRAAPFSLPEAGRPACGGLSATMRACFARGAKGATPAYRRRGCDSNFRAFPRPAERSSQVARGDGLDRRRNWIAGALERDVPPFLAVLAFLVRCPCGPCVRDVVPVRCLAPQGTDRHVLGVGAGAG